MEKITIDELLKKVGTKYGLVNLVAKRAKEMQFGKDDSLDVNETIRKIFEEIVQDKIAIKKGEADENKQKESK